MCRGGSKKPAGWCRLISFPPTGGAARGGGGAGAAVASGAAAAPVGGSFPGIWPPTLGDVDAGGATVGAVSVLGAGEPVAGRMEIGSEPVPELEVALKAATGSSAAANGVVIPRMSELPPMRPPASPPDALRQDSVRRSAALRAHV